MTSILVPLGKSGLFACVDECDAVVLSTTWWITYAARAYDELARLHHGAFARLNFTVQ